MSILGAICYVLMLIGSLNWGLVGAFGFDLVAWLFGEGSFLAQIVYIVVGIAALVSLVLVIIHYIKKSRI
ncbi:TPA: DUF378 domain-containing protein [Candidatus Galligastranaerophilus intestinavium]|uniref:DUF378 domain-containing protein n=1 Tax=Candidatus Galligastranaerophilus intestinavium TaxID=2840836 RepID=A0A9D1JXZ0_9BACT|nr:DUF378 domain-containing protein [Candidatus Galligastranaerophilus intestinavium]